ncbi:hypothetical protein N9K20_03080 [Methylophilaceae bacterium]|nr:hypothetical protein [Methylophilaceae bacterium]
MSNTTITLYLGGWEINTGAGINKNAHIFKLYIKYVILFKYVSDILSI